MKDERIRYTGILDYKKKKKIPAIVIGKFTNGKKSWQTFDRPYCCNYKFSLCHVIWAKHKSHPSFP